VSPFESRQASTSSRRRNDASKPNASLANGTPRTRSNVTALASEPEF
ncbi:uncharacterized protein METZ01_LOCUS182692, partial [marine metagenome]